MTTKLKKLDRKRKRVFHIERRSERWKNLNKSFKQEVKLAKKLFYKNTIADLKEKSPGQWYSALKRITSSNQQSEQINIQEIRHLSDQDQAEQIAEKFCAIPNEYDALQSEDIQIPFYRDDDIPQFHPSQVWLHLTRLKTNKATTPGDFPAKLIKEFAALIAEPLTDIINTSKYKKGGISTNLQI